MIPESPAVRMVCVALFLLVLPGRAGATEEDLHALFDAPCQRYGVPKPLALAIARKESAMSPWIMNIEGRTVRNASREEALNLSRAALRLGLSFDIGVMQINSQWLRRYDLPLEAVMDPRGNIQVGTWILAQEIKRHGLTWRAVAAYHTPHTDSERGRAYAEDVIRRIIGPAAPAASGAWPPASGGTALARDKAAASPLLVKRYRVVSND
jgi:soluble lytic murein transglycosylase-like protein